MLSAAGRWLLLFIATNALIGSEIWSKTRRQTMQIKANIFLKPIVTDAIKNVSLQ